MTLKIPTSIHPLDKVTLTKIDDYLQRNQYPFIHIKQGGGINYNIEIGEPIDAYWIGCNVVAICYGLNESGLISR